MAMDWTAGATTPLRKIAFRTIADLSIAPDLICDFRILTFQRSKHYFAVFPSGADDESADVEDFVTLIPSCSFLAFLRPGTAGTVSVRFTGYFGL